MYIINNNFEVIKIKNLIIVDISNIAYHNSRGNGPKIKNIDYLFSQSLENTEIIGIADNALYHEIDDKDRYKSEYLKSELIYEAPAGIPADEFILTYAFMNDVKILSNDRFNNYDFIPKNWLAVHRIRYMVIQGQFIFQRPIEMILENTKNCQNEESLNNCAIILK